MQGEIGQMQNSSYPDIVIPAMRFVHCEMEEDVISPN